MPRLIRNLVLLGVVSVMSLLFCELVVRGFVGVRNVGPSFSVYDPEYGKRLRRSFSTTRIAPEFTMRLTTNSLGFRGPEPKEVPKGAIVFLGDSFTMGYGVDDGEEFPALVRRRLATERSDPIPVINAGIGNTGNGRWVKFLRAEAAGYAPRAVVLQVHANDFGDNLREGLFRLEEDGVLDEQPVPAPGMGRRAQRFVEAIPGLSHSYLVGLAKQMSWPRVGRSGDDPGSAAAGADVSQPGDRLTIRLVQEALASCASQGWPVLLVLVDVEEPRSGRLRQAAARNGAAVLEIPPKSERPDLYFEVDGHWTTAGHVYTADRIVEHLGRLPLSRRREGSTP